SQVSPTFSAARWTLITLCRDTPCASMCLNDSPSARSRSTNFALIFRTIRITPSAAWLGVRQKELLTTVLTENIGRCSEENIAPTTGRCSTAITAVLRRPNTQLQHPERVHRWCCLESRWDTQSRSKRLLGYVRSRHGLMGSCVL